MYLEGTLLHILTALTLILHFPKVSRAPFPNEDFVKRTVKISYCSPVVLENQKVRSREDFFCHKTWGEILHGFNRHKAILNLIIFNVIKHSPWLKSCFYQVSVSLRN